MKNILFLLVFLLFCSNNYITKENIHLDFLKKQNKSAKDYVISLFKDYDLVILCERDHKEFTQYELFSDIVKDSYFIENVGHIFTEVGVANMDEKINEFLQNTYQDSLFIRGKITTILREIDSSPYWHCYSYPWFLGELFKVNQNLNKDRKLILHPSDVEFDWAKCRTAKDYKAFDNSIVNRDSMLAQNIIKRFNLIQSGGDRRKKALVVMNYKHAFLKDHRFFGEITHNTGRYLSDQYKGKVASVYIMGLAIPQKGSYSLVKNGEWDYYFESSKKTDIGFNFANSPFGSEEFDVIPPDSILQFKYEDMFTGLIFHRSVQEHKLRTGWDGFASSDFLPELSRRVKVFVEGTGMKMTEEEIEKILFENNTEKTFQYKNIESLRKKIDQWKNGL